MLAFLVCHKYCSLVHRPRVSHMLLCKSPWSAPRSMNVPSDVSGYQRKRYKTSTTSRKRDERQIIKRGLLEKKLIKSIMIHSKRNILHFRGGWSPWESTKDGRGRNKRGGPRKRIKLLTNWNQHRGKKRWPVQHYPCISAKTTILNSLVRILKDRSCEMPPFYQTFFYEWQFLLNYVINVTCI